MVKICVHFGTEQVGVESNNERSNPHADEKIRECLFYTALGTEGTKTGNEKGDAERSPHVPLFPYLFIVSFPGHGDFDFVKYIIEVSFLRL